MVTLLIRPLVAKEDGGEIVGGQPFLAVPQNQG
jgi:hypothetical protein